MVIIFLLRIFHFFDTICSIIEFVEGQVLEIQYRLRPPPRKESLLQQWKLSVGMEREVHIVQEKEN